MNDLEKNTFTPHNVQLLQVGPYTSISKKDVIERFGSAPDGFKCLQNNLWNEVKPLLDWILSNTPYKLVGVSKDNGYTNFFFVN